MAAVLLEALETATVLNILLGSDGSTLSIAEGSRE